ncbi:MAG: indolepyruvate ferredoxin oxidoreductase subunit alpha, partial [Candidatus Bathyarchaeia archaeon]
DPECWSSQNEQDNRYYSMLAGIPCLEPSNAQEAKDMAVEAFSLSEKLEVPVLLRPTTRVNHTLIPVTLGDVDKGTISPGFVK